MRDIAVVGAGPAGATAAIHLRRAGRSVLLVDRHSFPRDKACGDGLIPDALAALERLGLAAEVRGAGKSATAAVVYSPGGVRIELAGEFVVLRRRELDAMILGRALREGADFRRGRAVGLRRLRDGSGMEVEIAGGAEPVRARVVVLATGADVSLLEGRGMVERAEPSAVAARRYVRSPVRLEELLISFDRAAAPGYGWIFPLGGGEYNVGCGIFYRGGSPAHAPNLRDLLESWIAGFAPARELMRRATRIGPLKGARLRCGLAGARAWDGGRVLAVGETIGTTFPFTGEGIGKAMETAEIAAAVVHEALAASDAFAATDDPAASDDAAASDDPAASDALTPTELVPPNGPDAAERALRAHLSRYPALLEERLRHRYHGYEVAERWLARPWLSDFLARGVRRSSRLRETAAGILAEHSDPREVFSARGLARAVLRR